MSSVPCFKNLKGFPEIKEESKIEVIEFLDASQEVVQIIESFGRIFLPVVKDMQGNVEKLKKCHKKDPKKFIYLDNLLESISEKESIKNSILWLKRSFHLIYLFLTNILNDQMLSESVKHHLQDAYDKTLKPYHGLLVQTTVSLIFRWLPKRSELFGKGRVHDENIKAISGYLPNMQLHIVRIDELLMVKK